MEPEEGEFVIDWAINNLNLELIPIELSAGDPSQTEIFDKQLPGIDKCRRFWPHTTNTQGFFVAKLKKGIKPLESSHKIF